MAISNVNTRKLEYTYGVITTIEIAKDKDPWYYKDVICSDSVK